MLAYNTHFIQHISTPIDFMIREEALVKMLSGCRTKNALLAGVSWFGHFRKAVDKVNVFPVPDGNTGKNMHYAFQAAQKEIAGVPGKSSAEVAWAAARGALMGGRGCSGMILSGFFAGFAEGVGDKKALSAQDLALAFQVGCVRARERIDHPVEGTILTVGESAARHAMDEAEKSKNLIDVIVSAWRGAETALQNTPKQLKILKENNVVDAGGMGLVCFLEGMVRFNFRQPLSAEAALPLAPDMHAKIMERSEYSSPFKYCVEFIVRGEGLTRQVLQETLQPLGIEVMIASAEAGIYKVHLHSKKPDQVLQQVALLGAIAWQKVDDMEKQHQHALQELVD